MQELVFHPPVLTVSITLKSRSHVITYLPQKSLFFPPFPSSVVNLGTTKKIRHWTVANGDKTHRQLMKPSDSVDGRGGGCLYLSIFHLFHLVADKPPPAPALKFSKQTVGREKLLLGSKKDTHPKRMCCLLQFVVRTVFRFGGLPSSSVFVPSTANVLLKAIKNDSFKKKSSPKPLINIVFTWVRILIISCKLQKDKK